MNTVKRYECAQHGVLEPSQALFFQLGGEKPEKPFCGICHQEYLHRMFPVREITIAAPPAQPEKKSLAYRMRGLLFNAPSPSEIPTNWDNIAAIEDKHWIG